MNRGPHLSYTVIGTQGSGSGGVPVGSPAMGELRIRQAVRGLIIDNDGLVLLVHFRFPDRSLWHSPGGGIEPGETHHQALRRELAEEVGLVDVPIGPHVWTRRHIFPFPDGSHDGQEEACYLVRTEHFEPQP